MTSTIAVVVPTYRRENELRKLVADLFAQDLATDFTVVVVDDCSPDGTPRALEELSAQYGRRLVTLRQDTNKGPAAARNRGWRSVDAELIAFIDDDCRPDPAWLRSLAGALASADVVEGRTLPDPADQAHRGTFSHTIEVTGPKEYFLTCNIGYRRSTLEALGGFDESFPGAFGEDQDLGWRAKKAGFAIAFCDDALVYHQITPSNWRTYMKYRRRRATFPLLCKKHPELRRDLTLGIFLHPSVLAIAGAIATGLVAGRWRAVGWVAAGGLSVRYAVKTVRTATPPDTPAEWLTVVPLYFAADVTDTVMAARSSLRYRTLVL